PGAAWPPSARERAVEPAERLEPDQVAKHEHVQRNLETKLALDLRRGVGVLAGLVVLREPAGSERVDVDPVDLSGQGQLRAEFEAALQLRRGTFVPEGDLEAARDERQLRLALLLDERPEVAPERLVELAQLHLCQVHS